MVTFWLVSLTKRDVSIVDIAWGLGFVFIAWVSWGWVQFTTDYPGSLFLTLMVTVWGSRLSGYLAWRNHGQPEDYRYAAMRDYSGDSFWWKSLFKVFALQGVVMWVVALPIIAGQLTEGEFRWWQGVGVAVWATGFFFEAVGDWQLASFKSDPANVGQVLNRGLWRLTRHPNYFGDACVWWGFFLFAAQDASKTWLMISPLIMSIFLMRVSGVTLLEKSLKTNKPGYEKYMRTTNAFFPWWPRKS